MVTNSPAAILRPSCERSASGGYLDRLGLGHGDAACRRPYARHRSASSDFMHVNVVGRGAAATADEANADIDELLGVTRHVLRRAEIDIASLDRARHAGVGLRRKRGSGHGAHALQCIEHGHRTDAAVAADDVGAPFFQLRTVVLGAEPSRQLPSSSMVTWATTGRCGIHLASGQNRLMQLFQIAEGLQDEQVDAFFIQGGNLLAEGVPGFVERNLAQRLDADAQRTDGAGDQGVETLGSLARQRGHPGG